MLIEDKTVLGFYSISACTVEPKTIDIRWPNHPIPVILLGRLAIDKRSQMKGFGRLLIADSFLKAISVSKIIGCSGIITDAKDDAAVEFYRKTGFKSLKSDEYKLYISIKTIETI